MKRPFLWGLFIGLLFSFSAIFLLFFTLGKDLPTGEDIRRYKPILTSKVFDEEGKLIYEFGGEKRVFIPLEEIPPIVRECFIAVEDKRFYSHWGIDLIRLFGALFYNLKSLSFRQGASTITQQLARNMFLTPEKSLKRKIKEAILAIRLEITETKEEILERYLNQVCFGHGVYGIEAAANFYFGKKAKELTLSEGALLASLVKRPETYSPLKNPDKALERRNLFLKVLLKQKKIKKEEYDRAVSSPLSDLVGRRIANEAPYAMEMIRLYIEDKYGEDFLYRRGAKIYTTLNLRMQREANIALETKLREIEENYKLKVKRADYKIGEGKPSYLQGALLAVEPKTGYVRALVGGRDFRHSQFNRVTQMMRQAGSAFKVFVFTAAIDNGYYPSQIEVDGPISIPIAGLQEPYEPKNYDRNYIGPISLRKALALSRNVIAVKLTERLKPTVVRDYAYRLGIKSPLRAYLSIALGSSEVSLWDMTFSFATLANYGKRVKPILIKRIETDEGIIEENLPTIQEVISPQTAFLVTKMMESVLDEGTGYLARRFGFERKAAGKTGTTDDFTDAWFIGFTPQLCCGVWVGYDQKKTIFQGATGGVVACPIWAEFMKRALKDYPEEEFTPPESIVQRRICEATGLLANPRCPETREEYFILGKEPPVCDKH
ncbi:MAG: PBP1A family penicillin-binding protein [candidate division WOR-3 bacterium]